MLKYMKALLEKQMQMAAQFESAPQLSIREYTLRPLAPEREEELQAQQSMQLRQNRAEDAAEITQAPEQAAKEMLGHLSRAAARTEQLRLQKMELGAQEQTRRMERAMEQLQARQTVNLAARTPDNTAGGLIGSERRQMTVEGLASDATQRSMQEISRFFERDARRYG